jgi:hypothetical protein
MDLKDEISLEQVRNENECYRQTNQATIDCGMKALNGLFLLNGATATALFSQRDNQCLHYAAIIFAFAAILSVASLGASHLFNLILSETWRTTRPENDDAPWIPLPPLGKSLSVKELAQWRMRILVFCCCPGVLFIIGLVVAAVAIYSILRLNFL